MIAMRWTAVAGFSLLAGCATVVIDGHKIGESFWLESQKDVRSQASFVLHCPTGELTLHVLEVGTNNYPNYPTTIGVVGCGKEAVYKRTSAGWSANVIPSGG